MASSLRQRGKSSTFLLLFSLDSVSLGVRNGAKKIAFAFSISSKVAERRSYSFFERSNIFLRKLRRRQLLSFWVFESAKKKNGNTAMLRICLNFFFFYILKFVCDVYYFAVRSAKFWLITALRISATVAFAFKFLKLKIFS